MDRAETRRKKDRIDRIIGQNVRAERELRKMSREDLAETLDLTVSHIGLIERGERGTTAVTLEKLAHVLNISIDSLFAPSDRETFSAREEREFNLASNHRKISSLVTRLNEQETDFVLHVIKGLLLHHPTRTLNSEE